MWPVGEMAQQNAGMPEDGKQCGGAREAEIAEQRRAARDDDAETGKQRVKPRSLTRQRGAHRRLPVMVAQRADAVFERRAGNGPGAKLSIQPRRRPWIGQRKAKPHPGKTEELAELPQHHEPALPDLAREAVLARPDIHECLVNDQQATFRMQRRGQ